MLSGSAMWNWQVTPVLSLTNSVRFDSLGLYWNGPFVAYPPNVTGAPTQADYNNRAIGTVSYNSGLVYKPTDVDTIRVLASRGVQAPSLLDFADFGYGTTFSAPYALYLRPSFLDNYEVSYDRKVDVINSSVHVAVFHQIATGLLEYAFINAGSSIENGVELELKGSADSGLRWNAGYTYRAISDHISMNPTAGTNLIDFADGTPASKLTAGFGYSTGAYEFDVLSRWQSRYIDFTLNNNYLPAKTPIASYFELNARIGYHLTDDLIVAVSGEGLTQAKQIQTSGLPVERRIFLTATDNL